MKSRQMENNTESRIVMKATEAPNKIYLHVRANNEIGATWHGNRINSKDIEYVRADVFIKKEE